MFVLSDGEESFGKHHSPYRNYLETHEFMNDDDMCQQSPPERQYRKPGFLQSESRHQKFKSGRNYLSDAHYQLHNHSYKIDLDTEKPKRSLDGQDQNKERQD